MSPAKLTANLFIGSVKKSPIRPQVIDVEMGFSVKSKASFVMHGHVPGTVIVKHLRQSILEEVFRDIRPIIMNLVRISGKAYPPTLDDEDQEWIQKACRYVEEMDDSDTDHMQKLEKQIYSEMRDIYQERIPA